MKARTIDLVDQEIHNIDLEIQQRKKVILEKKKERRSLLRQERDQLRYVVGGLIFDHIDSIKQRYPKLLDELYEMASTRDKIKFSRIGLVQDNIKKLKAINKSECQESIRELEENEDVENLSNIDLENLKIIREAFKDPKKNLKRRIYGRKDEAKVYIGDNEERYISNELALFLKENEGYSE